MHGGEVKMAKVGLGKMLGKMKDVKHKVSSPYTLFSDLSEKCIYM